MHVLFAIGVAAGFVAGALLSYVVTERLIRRIARLGHSTIVRVCALGAALFALLAAAFPAFVIGGNFGGAWAAFMLGQWAVAIGIGLGVELTLAVCSCGAAVVGALVGVAVSRALGKAHAA